MKKNILTLIAFLLAAAGVLLSTAATAEAFVFPRCAPGQNVVYTNWPFYSCVSPYNAQQFAALEYNYPLSQTQPVQPQPFAQPAPVAQFYPQYAVPTYQATAYNSLMYHNDYTPAYLPTPRCAPGQGAVYTNGPLYSCIGTAY